MASIINAALSGGLTTSADTSGILQLQTASTTAVTVTASQNVGIGTSSPAYKLDVAGAIKSNATGTSFLASGATTAARYAQIINDGSVNGVIFGTEGTTAGGIMTGTSSYSGIIAQTANLDLALGTNGTARLIINGAGRIKTYSTVSVGNATPATTGSGITFPATLDASSDANTLDDYEEGTWTASFVPNTSGSITMTNSLGTYTKVGRAVTITGVFKVSSVSSPTGYLKINGLPFSGSAGAQSRCSISIIGDGMNATMTTVLIANIQSGSEIYVFKTDGLGGIAFTSAADIKANTEIFIGGTYITD